MLNYTKEYEVARIAITKASAAIMRIYQMVDLGVQIKADASPVTKADFESNQIILSELQAAFPDYGYLSEEVNDSTDRLRKELVWIIDPLDGTADFIKRDDEFAINIALAKHGEIVLGLIMIPAKQELYFAFKDGGAFCEKDGEIIRLQVSDRQKDLIAVVTREHYTMKDQIYFEQHQSLIKEIRHIGSAYKACLIASGEADIQMKQGEGSKEWDIAPCVLLVKEAGGFFAKPNGEEYTFNKLDVFNHEGFLILNHRDPQFFVK